MLSLDDFAAFFEDVHGHTPFPWQRRLLAAVASTGEWPAMLDLPTGCGKTAAIDIAVFHLAMEADRGSARRAPVRIAFVVDRRLVVDDAFARAQRLDRALSNPRHPVTKDVADRLGRLSGGNTPLNAVRLRGGLPYEDSWTRTPSQPTVLCSTVDQIGSRLLFRGYGVTDSMKPVHAGLIGSDCLILLDEAHLAEAFRQTLSWVTRYQGPEWRQVDAAAPWAVSLLTATPGATMGECFSLDDEDRSHPLLAKRLNARKPARLIAPVKRRGKRGANAEGEDGEKESRDADVFQRARALVKHVREALDHFEEPWNGAPCPAIGVVVNRVARARAVFDSLMQEISESAECLLLIGPARPLDRESLAHVLARIRTGAERNLQRPLVLVATQCIEAGVDIDLDALITEVAPLDCLRQRFGRLNRAGRDILPYARIVANGADLSSSVDDPVYGGAIRPAWDALMEAATKDSGDPVVELGLGAFAVRMVEQALAPKADAPVLMPAHLDLLSQTSPVPTADPDVSLFLHGPSRQADSITVVWRADIDPDKQTSEEVRRLLTLIPPRSLEAIELPHWAVRRWLMNDSSLGHLADIPTRPPETEPRVRSRRMAFRWKGNDDRSRWIAPRLLRPGDTIVVPASYGGVDGFGWNPSHKEPATDLGRRAAQTFAGRRFAIRIAPGLLDGFVTDAALADALAGAVSSSWRDLRSSLIELNLPEDIRGDLAALDSANRKASVTASLDLYGTDEGRPRGVVFVAPFGIRGMEDEGDGWPNTTEDDAIGSFSGFPLSLQQHSHDVERKVEAFARAAGLSSERIADLTVAGFLHDAGKADPRFQAWLYYGDPLGPEPGNESAVLAKSGRALPPMARTQSGLPERWRHEALSVRLSRASERLRSAHDPDLVLWLIGSHHGYGRPFFPHLDPTERIPEVGPQSLAFSWNGLDWPSLFVRLKHRYGVWELARMEAILRLADHRASEERAREVVS